jgi:FMN phosphatase YigB (HAD superfamily)
MNPDIITISFDFWNTIASPNPAYSIARNNFLSHMLGVDEETVIKTHRVVKSNLDNDAETLGVGHPSLLCVYVLCKAIYNEEVGIPVTKLMAIKRGLDDIAVQYPPLISDENVAEIKRVSAEYGVGITSNTNFISGKALRRILENRGLLFDFYIFSDEVGSSKPGIDIFVHTIRQSCCTPSGILHIGDSKNCDGGAETMSIKTHIINNPSELPAVLRTL